MKIFKAIKNKDSKYAKKAMRNHIKSIEKDWFG
jgi:DNA-binding FadR family transcriptional regulator